MKALETFYLVKSKDKSLTSEAKKLKGLNSIQIRFCDKLKLFVDHILEDVYKLSNKVKASIIKEKRENEQLITRKVKIMSLYEQGLEKLEKDFTLEKLIKQVRLMHIYLKSIGYDEKSMELNSERIIDMTELEC